MSGWACPRCKRRFTRENQRHACGTGSRAEVLRGRSPELVALYGELEAFVKALGAVEVVARARYVLQQFGSDNHRAFAALDPCRADGESCETGIDCCSGFCTDGVCGPPRECAKTNEACQTSQDCCDPKEMCIAGFCGTIIVQ